MDNMIKLMTEGREVLSKSSNFKNIHLKILNEYSISSSTVNIKTFKITQTYIAVRQITIFKHSTCFLPDRASFTMHCMFSSIAKGN